MPSEEKFYFVKNKQTYEWYGYYFIPTSKFDTTEFRENIEYWLEETLDREEELADFPYEQSLQERRANLTMNAQNLIWEIKNNAPKLLDDEE